MKNGSFVKHHPSEAVQHIMSQVVASGKKRSAKSRGKPKTRAHVQLLTGVHHPQESARRKAQLARVRQSGSCKRDVDRARTHQCEGESVVCRGFCGLQGKRSKDDGFAQPLRTIFEDLGQSVLSRSTLCFRKKTLLRNKNSEWASGVEAEACQAKDGSIQ